MIFKCLALLPAIFSMSTSPIKEPVMAQEETQTEERSENPDMDRNAMLITVLVTAGIGVTSIAVFYFLKNKKLID